MTINRERYAGEAILRAADLKDGQILTIEWFREIKTQLRDRPIQPAVQFKEYDNPLPLNVTNLDILLEAFSDDETKWPGQKVKITISDVQTPGGDWTKGIRLTPQKSKPA